MSEEETRRAFSTNLRFYMKRENMNQADISRLLGVSESAVGKWLNLKSTPRMGMVEKLAMHFGINKSDLLEMHSKEPAPSKSPIPETLAAHFEGKEFDEDDLRDIANFVEFVAQRKKTMTDYEQLIDQVTENGIEVVEFDFSSERICGLYADNVIAINKHLPENKKRVTLLEEWGHATMNYGNILDLNNLNNRKQEESARRWAYEKHMPITKFIDIILDTKPTDAWELIETLDVPIEYFNELIRYYQQKYGPYKEFNGGCIWFDPINIALYKG